MTTQIQRDLVHAELAPSRHFLDTGYVTSRTLVTSQNDFGIELIGPAPKDVKWQAQADQGFDVSHFLLNWQQQQATCPQGHTSASWTPACDNRGKQVIKIKFSIKDCGSCPSRQQCIHSEKQYPRRTLTVRPQEQHEALQAARSRQQTAAFAQEYTLREGIEGTISQGVRAFDLRRSRYIGLSKTHLQHVGIAAAINLVRAVAWLDGKVPASTRSSAFQRLYYET